MIINVIFIFVKIIIPIIPNLIFLALFDIQIYGAIPDNINLDAVYNDLNQKVNLIPIIDGEHSYPSFHHIMHNGPSLRYLLTVYDAGYYT